MPNISISVGLWLDLLPSFLFVLASACVAAPADAVGIYTYHGDNMRTGWNNRETRLSPNTVKDPGFGKLWSRPVDGQVYAQPLLAPGIRLGATGTRNLVIVATEHNSVYAFNADIGADPLWQTSLGPSVPSDARGVPCADIAGTEYGITSTPVIDPATGILYVVAKTLEGTEQHYRLHALHLDTGQEQLGWPVEIQGSVVGEGGGSAGGRIAFDPRIQNQRAGLLLLNGRIIIAFSAHCDIAIDRYHGWVFSYNSADPTQPPAIFNATPDRPTDPSGEAAAGIWQSGFGPAADETGSIYFETGNGLFNADVGGHSVGDSFVRLTTEGGGLSFTPTPANYFTPNTEQLLDENDFDLGSGGAMVIPDQTGTATPHLLVGSGKDGAIRLLNREMLGGHIGRSNALLADRALQIVSNPGTWPYGAVFGGPAYWEGPDGHYIFYTSATNPMRRYRLAMNPNGAGTSWLMLDAESDDRFGTGNIPQREEATPTPVVSSSGRTDGTGLVWLLRRDDNTLRAYRADDLTLVWQSRQGSSNELDGSVVKFTLPIVANGKVYAGTQSAIVCYGLR